MTLIRHLLVATACAVVGATAQAQAQEQERKQEHDWEGAIGLLASNGPAYAGADERKSKLLPGFYLRYGRLSLTNAGGFSTRNNDEVVRGLGLDLSPNNTVKVNLGLRFDGGRSVSTSGALKGLGSIKSTVRGRLAVRWEADEHWRLGAAFSGDLLGRNGGYFFDISVSREQRFSAETTWAAGVATSFAGARYLKSYFGITPEQAARTGYRVYEPGSGLRDVALFLNGRSQIAPRWVALIGASATCLLGPAADSPLTRQRSSLAINGGLAWTF